MFRDSTLLQFDSFLAFSLRNFCQRTPWVEKRGGGWKTSRMTPLPKNPGFGPPSYGAFSTPFGCQCSVFSCTKIHDRADQILFWRGPKIFGRARSLVRFPPPIRFAPPHPDLPFLAFLEKARKITQKNPCKEIPCKEKSKEIQKSKERKIWAYHGPILMIPGLRLWESCDLRFRILCRWAWRRGSDQSRKCAINRERKKPINIKNFGGTPPGVRPVCPGDTSHLSRDMSRLSWGHSVPLVLIYTSIRPKCPRCPWDVPSLSLGRLGGIPTAKFLYVIFLYQFFLSIINNFWTKKIGGAVRVRVQGVAPIIYVRIFLNIWSVLGTANRPNINNFRDRQPASHK